MEGLPRRIVLTGSESTGKTTLARDLARHFGAPWVPEYAREAALAKGAPLDRLDVTPIALGQMAAQDAALSRATKLILFDTDLLSTEVYARHYYGDCPAWIVGAIGSRRADLYLLCDIDAPWIPDPARDRPHERERLQRRFRAALAERGFPVVDIRGGWEERFATACRAVTGLVTENAQS